MTVPAELQQHNQWVLWRYEGRGTKRTKVPYSIRGTNASSTNKNTWASYESVVTEIDKAGTHYDGIGFVLTEADPFVGVDLDHCITDGEIDAWAQSIVDKLQSYTEITPSGEGLRIFITGSLPAEGRKRGNFEVYSHARYLTVTGQHLTGTPLQVHARPQEILTVHHSVFGETSESPQNAPRIAVQPLSGAEVGNYTFDPECWPNVPKLSALLSNCLEFERTWNRTRRKFSSQSEYDLSIAHWCSEADWTGQEIINAVIFHRRVHGQDLAKALRPDYYLNPTYGLLAKVRRIL